MGPGRHVGRGTEVRRHGHIMTQPCRCSLPRLETLVHRVVRADKGHYGCDETLGVDAKCLFLKRMGLPLAKDDVQREPGLSEDRPRKARDAGSSSGGLNLCVNMSSGTAAGIGMLPKASVSWRLLQM